MAFHHQSIITIATESNSNTEDQNTKEEKEKRILGGRGIQSRMHYKENQMHYKVHWLGYNVTHDRWVSKKSTRNVRYIKVHFGKCSKVCAANNMIMTLVV